jgi:hypothetical protein
MLSGLLWLRSVTEAEWYSRHHRRIWLGFEQVTADWRDSIRRVAQRFDMTWPVRPADAATSVASLLRPRSPEDASMEPGTELCALPFVRAWDAIEAGIAEDETAAQAGFDVVRAALLDADQLYSPIITDLMRRHSAGVQVMRSSTCWRLTAPLRKLKQCAFGLGA